MSPHNPPIPSHPPSSSLALLLILSLTVDGCATMKSNTFIGATVGATAGAVTGTVIGAPYHSGTGTLIGAASGAAIGALIGYLTQPKAAADSQGPDAKAMKLEPGDPAFTSPEVRRVWVPDKIEGNKFIKGHFMFVLERSSVWTMP